MKRAIHIFPVLPELSDIEAVRASYDPLAGKIAPHVTLAFPFELELRADELAAHVRLATETTAPFELTVGCPESKEAGYVWLPVMKGRTQVLHMHDQLYTGVLGGFRSGAHAYEPHLTVAHVPGSKVADAFRAAQTLNIAGVAWIDRVVVERIAENDLSEIESTVTLNHKQSSTISSS
jgi:2'-5' RNA ligase